MRSFLTPCKSGEQATPSVACGELACGDAAPGGACCQGPGEAKEEAAGEARKELRCGSDIATAGSSKGCKCQRNATYHCV